MRSLKFVEMFGAGTSLLRRVTNARHVTPGSGSSSKVSGKVAGTDYICFAIHSATVKISRGSRTPRKT